MSTTENELQPSKLGTKEYWDEVYAKEMEQHDEEVGSGWFGENATNRVINWMVRSPLVTCDSKILDIGCGGGEVLIALYNRGFDKLSGTDYSENALKVAKANLGKEEIPKESIVFHCHDITTELLCSKKLHDDGNVFLSSAADSAPNGYDLAKFDICLDKGTYDAISLCSGNPGEKRKKYIENLNKLLVKGGVFIIVSCNWTSEELKNHFSDYQFLEEIKARTFSFGGKTGQTVSTCVFTV